MINRLLHAGRAKLLAGCLVALCPLAFTSARADDAAKASTPQGCDRDSHHEHRPDGGPGGPNHFGPPGMGGPSGPFDGPRGGPGGFGPGFGAGPPPYLRELKLTEDQEDKVFAIVHAAEPGMRDAAKAAHKAHDALHDAGSSPQYSESAVATLVQTQVKADTQMTLLRIKTEHDIYTILSPEQRNKVAELKKDHDAHRHDGPPR